MTDFISPVKPVSTDLNSLHSLSLVYMSGLEFTPPHETH